MNPGLHRAALETMAARLLYLLSRLALPPLVLAHIGLAEYGLWSIAFVVVGYLGLSVSGLATVYVREIAIAHQQGNAVHASQMLSTGVLLAGLIGGSFCGAVALLLPQLLAYFQLDAALQPLATRLILATCLVFLADLTLGAWGYVLNGLKLIRTQQRIWMASFMLEWLAAALLLHLGLGMDALLWAFALRYALSIGLSWHSAQRAWPALQLGLRHVSRGCLQRYLRLGLLSQGSDNWAMLLHSADRLLTGIGFGSAGAALLDLGSKFPATATSISSGISQVLLPHAATARATELAELYRQGLRLSLLALLPLMPLLVALAPALLGSWLGPRPELATLVAILLWVTPAWHLHILTGAASSTLRGQGRLGLEYLYHLLRSLGLLLAWWLASDLLGFIAGVALSLAGSAVIYLLLASQRIGVTPRQIGRDTLLPLLLAYLPAYLLVSNWHWQLNSRMAAIGSLLEVAALLAIPWLLMLWCGLLHGSERQQLLQLAGRWRG